MPTAAGAPALDLSWVTPRLAVGARYPLAAASYLARELGLTHVVDLRVEDCDDRAVLEEHGIELLHLPTLDTRAVSQEMLDAGVAWVGEKLDAGHRVYIHCEHGIGRSATLALCVLVARGEEPVRALSIAKAARRKVSPSPEQLEAFRAWISRFRARSGRRIDVPSLDDLATVAYSHLQGAVGTGTVAG